MASFYLVVVPQGVVPSWSHANIATNSGWTATTIAYHDADTDPGTGATYVFTPDASGLTADTPYDLWAVWDDGEKTVGPVQGTSFTTTPAEVFSPTFYLAIYPVGAATPTWSPTNIGTNSGWSGSPVYHDADVDPGTGSTYQFVPDASGLTPGTSYDTYVVWYDGATTVGPVQGTGFTTAAAGVDISGSLSATEQGGDTAIIVGGNHQTGYLVAQESGEDSLISYGEISQLPVPDTPTPIDTHIQICSIKSLVNYSTNASLIYLNNSTGLIGSLRSRKKPH